MLYFRTYGFHTINQRHYALKEGFNVKNGNSLKAFGDRYGDMFPDTVGAG